MWLPKLIGTLRFNLCLIFNKSRDERERETINSQFNSWMTWTPTFRFNPRLFQSSSWLVTLTITSTNPTQNKGKNKHWEFLQMEPTTITIPGPPILGECGTLPNKPSHSNHPLEISKKNHRVTSCIYQEYKTLVGGEMNTD